MGVKNLWRLLLPAGRRLSIESLSHQTLAIDASIWMVQISAACRDPETGRLLPNRPHVRIFLSRLMRLLYHRIRPVVVFDGAMPEVKRREIQRRKDRRERLWRDDDDDGDGSGGGALRRTAKKILVKQLKEWREKEARTKKGDVGNAADADDGAHEEKKGDESLDAVNGGAFAPGFTLADEERVADTTSSPSAAQSSPNTNNNAPESNKDEKDEREDDVISIDSNDSKERATQQFRSGLDHFQREHMGEGGRDGGDDDGDDSENDWEMSHAVQSLLEQSSSSNKKKAGETNNHADDDTTSSNHMDENAFDDDIAHRQNKLSTTNNETIASLSSEARHHWIDDQWKAHRVRSRRECLRVAADPENYSSAQLQNFLKTSRLTKRVKEIGKLVEERKTLVGEDHGGREDGGGGFAVVSHSNVVQGAGGTVLQRLRRHNSNKRSNGNDDDDDGDEIFDSGNGAQASMKVLFGEDDSDSDGGGGGGGFLLPSSSDPSADPAAPFQKTSEKKNAVVLLDDGSDHDGSSENDTSVAAAENRTGAPDAPVNQNGECVVVGQNNATSAAPNTKDSKTSAFQPSKFLELSMAGRAWEEWGEDMGDDDDAIRLEAETDGNTSHKTVSDRSALDKAQPASEESESDDDGQDGTFLMLGQATKRAVFSNVVKKVVKEDASETEDEDAMSQHGAGTEEEGEDVDDDVDWEDGEPDENSVADEVDGGDDDDSKNNADEPTLDDHVDFNSGNIGGFAYHPSTIHASSSAEGRAGPKGKAGQEDEDYPQKVACKENTEHNHTCDITEIPSEHERVAVREVDADMKTGRLESGTTTSNGEKQLLTIDSSDDSQSENGTTANNGEKQLLTIDSSDDSRSGNEFDSFTPNDPQAAAFKHAQETASRLTSWAGRAFQRAISAHVGHQSQSDSPNLKRDNDDDVFDVDAVINEGSAEIKDTHQHNTTGMNDERSHDSSPKKSQRMPELFDTSLEGLNEAHHAIRERERAMERDMDATITDEMKEDILKLLQLCGIPWIESPSEAEAQCAALEELGLVSGIVTEDSDAFVFGGKKVYKNFFAEQKYVEAYYARDIERDLALKRHQFVALAMLLGGDYTDGVKGVGIVNGMEILQAFTVDDSADGIKHSLSRFREWLDGFGDTWIDDGDGDDNSPSRKKEALFHKKHKSARTRWVPPADFPSQPIINAYLKPTVDKSEATFSWGKPDLNGLQQYCAETLGWEQEETDRVVKPVLNVLESGSNQTRLESYFMKYEDGIKFAKVRSKRLKSVLHDIHNANADDIECAAAAADEMDVSNIDEDVNPKRKRQRKK